MVGAGQCIDYIPGSGSELESGSGEATESGSGEATEEVDSDDGGLGAGAIAAIVVVALLVVSTGVGFIFYRRKKSEENEDSVRPNSRVSVSETECGNAQPQPWPMPQPKRASSVSVLSRPSILSYTEEELSLRGYELTAARSDGLEVGDTVAANWRGTGEYHDAIVVSVHKDRSITLRWTQPPAKGAAKTRRVPIEHVAKKTGATLAVVKDKYAITTI
jgi:hypothetical protein